MIANLISLLLGFNIFWININILTIRNIETFIKFINIFQLQNILAKNTNKTIIDNWINKLGMNHEWMIGRNQMRFKMNSKQMHRFWTSSYSNRSACRVLNLLWSKYIGRNNSNFWMLINFWINLWIDVLKENHWENALNFYVNGSQFT